MKSVRLGTEQEDMYSYKISSLGFHSRIYGAGQSSHLPHLSLTYSDVPIRRGWIEGVCVRLLDFNRRGLLIEGGCQGCSQGGMEGMLPPTRFCFTI